jgi:putative glutamine amidotransferase
VQWHPEYLPQHQKQRRLFQALVQHAREVQLQIEDDDLQEALASPQSPALKALEEKEEELLLELKEQELKEKAG